VGFVDVAPRKSVYVAKMNARTFKEIFDLRVALECMAVELALAGAIVGLPALQPWFGTASLSPGEFFLAWPFALGLVLMDEARRWLIRRGTS
jgi:sodium/potassium-transporting ATPase subunit alpha